MTHQYTLLLGGAVLAGDGAPEATAIAYAHDTVLAVGTDREVQAISRGDSHTVHLGGLSVVPAAHGATLEAGAPASFRIIDGEGRTVAVVRDGRLVEGGVHGL